MNTSVSEKKKISSWNINNKGKHCIGKGCEAVTISQFYFTLIFWYSLYWAKLQSVSLPPPKQKAPSEKWEGWEVGPGFAVPSEFWDLWKSCDNVHTHLVLSWPDWLPLPLEKAAPFYKKNPKTKQNEGKGKGERRENPQSFSWILVFLAWHPGAFIHFMDSGVMPLVMQLQCWMWNHKQLLWLKYI